MPVATGWLLVAACHGDPDNLPKGGNETHPPAAPPSAVPMGDLRFTEVMTDNEDTLDDRDGDSPDWIE